MRLRIRVMPRHCKKALPNFSLKEKGGGAPAGASTGSRIADQFARYAQTSSVARRALITARSPFGAPPRLLGSGPRFLELPGASGRTLPGASAASTSQSDHAPDRPMPRTAQSGITKPAVGTAPAPSVGHHRWSLSSGRRNPDLLAGDDTCYALSRRPAVNARDVAAHQFGLVACGNAVGDTERVDALRVSEKIYRARPVGAP